jgi:hypothetical protein
MKVIPYLLGEARLEGLSARVTPTRHKTYLQALAVLLL